jgi:hypothetical protein
MLYLALRFHEKGRYESHADPTSRRKPKVSGYQVVKPAYHILKLLAGDQVNDIPRSRIVEYHYVTVGDTVRQQGSYFILPVEENQLSQIEAITKLELHPSVYLWRDEAWWSFPQLEMYNTGEMTTVRTTMGDLFGNVHETREHQIEKTALRIRPTYEPSKGPGFALTHTTPNSLPDAPANLPTSITGNGMVLEWKRGYDDKPPCWWLRDERRVSKAQSATYRHYTILKATPHTRWSKGFSAWYYIGGSLPPQKWLELVGYTGSASPAMPPELSQQIEAVLAADDAAEREPLLPLSLYDANAGRYDWNYGNPDVWCKFVCGNEWLFFVANASLTERSLYGYKLKVGENPITGEWLTLTLDELVESSVQRDPSFIHQSLRRAIEQTAASLKTFLPEELGIPTDAECRRLVFEERHQAYLAELERKRELAAQMKPYHEFQALLRLRQAFEERLYHLTSIKALPAQSTPPLDDPWS